MMKGVRRAASVDNERLGIWQLVDGWCIRSRYHLTIRERLKDLWYTLVLPQLGVKRWGVRRNAQRRRCAARTVDWSGRGRAATGAELGPRRGSARCIALHGGLCLSTGRPRPPRYQASAGHVANDFEVAVR